MEKSFTSALKHEILTGRTHTLLHTHIHSHIHSYPHLHIYSYILTHSYTHTLPLSDTLTHIDSHTLIYIFTHTCTLTHTLIAFSGSSLTSPLCYLAKAQNVSPVTLQPKDPWTSLRPSLPCHSQDLLSMHKPFPDEIWGPIFLSHPTHLCS